MSQRRVSPWAALLLPALLALAGCGQGEEAQGELSPPTADRAPAPDAAAASETDSGTEAPVAEEGTVELPALPLDRPEPRPPRPAPNSPDRDRPAPREHRRAAPAASAEPGAVSPAPPPPLAAEAEQRGPSAGGLVAVPAGTRVKVVLLTPLSSRETRAGDSFEARPLHGLLVDDVEVPLEGGRILGRVALVALPDEEEGRPGILTLDFHTLRTSESEEYAFRAVVTGEAAIALLRALPGKHVDLAAGTSMVVTLTRDALLPPV